MQLRSNGEISYMASDDMLSAIKKKLKILAKDKCIVEMLAIYQAHGENVI